MTGIFGWEVYWDKLSIGGAEDNERQGDSLGASSSSLRIMWWNGGSATHRIHLFDHPHTASMHMHHLP